MFKVSGGNISLQLQRYSVAYAYFSICCRPTVGDMSLTSVEKCAVKSGVGLIYLKSILKLESILF